MQKKPFPNRACVLWSLTLCAFVPGGGVGALGRGQGPLLSTLQEAAGPSSPGGWMLAEVKELTEVDPASLAPSPAFPGKGRN